MHLNPAHQSMKSCVRYLCCASARLKIFSLLSVAMQTARAVRECIDMIEKATGKLIDVLSLSYNRLMNHMKYMVARASTGEKLNLDMNEYMLDQYPQAYKVATDICKNLEGCIGHKLDETETGYLAMHISE